jgi:hypothetical protein
MILETVDEQMEEEAKWELEQGLYKEDLLNLLKYIVNNLLQECKNSKKETVSLVGLVKSLSNLLEKCGRSISSMPEFRQLLKDKSIELVGQLLLTFDHKVLKNTCQLILTLFRRFRQILKVELYIILDVFVINTIKSVTSEFYQKHYLLNLLSKMLSQKAILVDVFVNFDCCPGFGNLLEKSFGTLCNDN